MTGGAQTERAVPVGHEGPPVTVEAYVVRGASTLRGDQQAILELVGAGFCRSLGEELSSLLRTEVGLALRPAEQLPWRAILAALGEPFTASIVRWGASDGVGLVSVEIPLAVALVDRLLGGPGRSAPHPHPLTEVEVELLTGVVNRSVAAFASALTTVVALDPATGGNETRLSLIKSSRPNAELVVIDVVVTLHPAASGEPVEGCVRLALPAADLVPHIDAFVGSVGGGRVRRLDPEAGLLDASVEVAARFDPAQLTKDELADLAVGDVITLPHAVGHPLRLFAANTPYLRALPGRRSGHVAVEIVATTPGAPL